MSEDPLAPLNDFRSYLEVLARGQIGPRLRQRMSVSDLVQNTLLEAEKGKDRFRGSNARQQGAWLREILAKQIAMAHRFHHAEKRDLDRELALQRSMQESWMNLERCLAAQQPTPSRIVSREEGLERMVGAIARLPEDQQETILLRFCGERSVEEIAEELGVDRRTVARRVRRGLDALREELGDD